MDKLLLGFWIFLFAAIVGLIVKWILDQQDNDMEITWTEYVYGMLIVGILLSILGVNVGWGMARNNLKSFNELWGGWEKDAWPVPVDCTKDGPCVHEYSCDPYIVETTRSCDSDGDGESDDTCTDRETKYHDCPVYTRETSYLMTTTLDQEFTMGDHCVDASPVRWGVGSSDFEAGQTAANACVGIPPVWDAVNYRVNVLHQPGPAFKKNVYDNLVIAADQELFKEYSAYVQQYLDAGLLPMVVSPDQIHDFYWSEPIYFVGFAPADLGSWWETMRYLDGGFGDELHGTVHVVVIQSPLADQNPDRYVTSLKAYWQDPKRCGDNCFPKNGVLIVIGTTDGQTVSWARAETGMPVGNTDLIAHAMTDFVGVSITPNTLLGRIVPEPYIRDDGKAKVRVLHPNPGAVETLVWGLQYPETIFVRISMKAKDPDDVGTGFNFLDALIRPTKTQQRWIVVVCSILAMFVWVAMALIGERQRARRSYRSTWR